MLKKISLYLLALSMLTITTTQADNCKKLDSCDCEVTGRSYLAIRPQFQSASPELVSGFRQQQIYMRENGRMGAFQIVPFGSATSTNDQIKRYFTPFCKTELIVDEDINATDKDLFTQHFNIFTNNGNFRSTISFEPKQSTFGLGLHYRQGFWRNEEKNHGWFFSVSSPLTHIKNEFKLTEKVINTGGGPNENADENVVANMKEAFAQKEWLFGRIESAGKGKSCIACPQTETKLADIEVKIGIEWLENDPCHLESYLGIVIPTGNKSNAKNIFQAIVGNGKHVGIISGTSFGVRIWQHEEKGREIRTECAINSAYLFQNKQVRSFDLKNKPFSRYMEMYIDKEQAEQAASLQATDPSLAQNLATPGINIMTRGAQVTPGFQFNMTNAFVFNCDKGFQAEAGYNLFARKAECISLCQKWQPGPALKQRQGLGFTNPVRDITGNIFLDSLSLPENNLAHYDDNIIKESDIDLASAATPAFISHTVFGVLGYQWKEREYPLLAHLGASYEFSNATNGGIERWTLWAKLGVAF